MEGYIKDYRKELQSDIWMMPPLYHRVWQYLKYKVNHSPRRIPAEDGSFFELKSGQHLTSIRTIAQGIGYYEGLKWKEPNPKTVAVILRWLVQNDMIVIDRGKGNRQYTLITLLKWEEYQPKISEGNRRVTRNGSGGKHETDINNNVKECLKNDKEIEVEEEERKTPLQPHTFFEQNIGKMGPMIAQSISEWCDDLSDGVVMYAMEISAKRGANSYSYVEKILREWNSQSVKTIESAKAYQLRNESNVKSFKGGSASGEVNRGSNQPAPRKDSITGNQVGWIGRNKA